MTPLEIALIQGAFILVIAPVCAGIANTIGTLVKHKTWAMPLAMYRRENSVIASVALGTSLVFGMLLPLLGLDGYAGLYGNVVTLIAILAIVGGASAFLDAKSVVPMALCSYGAALLAFGLSAASITSSGILIWVSGNIQPSTILVVIAMALVLLALRNDTVSDHTRDVRMVLQVGIGVFLVNLVAMMTSANLFTHEQPALNVLIAAGKAIGITLVIELLAAGVRRHAYATPERLVHAATFLGILAIILAVWFFTPTL